MTDCALDYGKGCDAAKNVQNILSYIRRGPVAAAARYASRLGALWAIP